MSKQLIKSGMVVSAMTLISRVLGLVRDVVIAQVMGSGVGADVFFFANKIPNFLRRLFAEGAFAQAFVPVLCEYQALENSQQQKKSQQLIAEVSGTLGVILSVVTLLGIIASPVIVALFGFGWFLDWYQGGENGAKFELASMLLKITFPYLWFISLTALAGAILNSIGKFAVSAFTPVILNVCIISAAITMRDWFSTPAYALAWGVFLGGLVQFLFQLPFLYRAGVLVKPRWACNAEGVRKIRKLLLPALFGVSVTQINLLVDTLIASFLVTGSISWLYYADRLLEFPLGLFGIGIATVILPSLSKQHANQDQLSFQRTVEWGIKIICFMGIPAMAGLMVLAKPIIMVLFLRGEFSLSDVTQVSFALLAYLSGLLSFMFIKILAPGYYARQDTKTPVKIGVIALVANMIFNLCLAPWIGYVGLALATTLSATLNATLLYLGLRRSGVYEFSAVCLSFVARIILATSVMVAVLWWYVPPFEYWTTLTLMAQIQLLISAIVIGLIGFLAACAVLAIKPSDFKANVRA